jgi:5-oxoprolinase (ATP-hydrolysing) subunit A
VTVAVNCDMGEAFGMWRLADDEAIMALVDLANVACGFHAGDPVVMRDTVAAAKAHGVAVGAHPSYPDLQGFGRRDMAVPPDELTAIVRYQVGALRAFLDAEGMALSHVKPHGALYGRAARDAAVAGAIAAAVAPLGVPLMGMAGTEHERVYAEHGIAFLAEYYADLDYDDDGGLLITARHAPPDHDEVARRVTRVLEEGIAETVNGQDIPMRADCICIHSDTPDAAGLARTVRAAVDAAHTT